MLSSDVWRAKRGLCLRRATSPDATIACHAAGNIPYYSDRRTIDLLGKSDRRIARTPPKRSFRPGHDRWDYEYGIALLKPDVVADEWGPLESFMSTRMQDEYKRLQCGMYVRLASDKVNRQFLERECE